MSKAKTEDREVVRLRNELKSDIDHRMKHNSEFTNLLRGDHSLFIALIALFVSLYGAWKLGFLAQYYVHSLYLVIIIWLFYVIRNTSRATWKAVDEGLTDIDLDEQEISLDWYLRWGKPLFRSLWSLSLLCIPVLLFIGEKRWWMWVPAVLFAIFLLLITGVGYSVAASDGNEYTGNEKKRKIKVSWVISLILFLLFLVIAVIYPYYRIIKELIFIVLETPYSLFEIIFTMILISVGLAALSEYLSLKFIVADVSRQNYTLSTLRTGIDEIGDVEILEEDRKGLRKLCLPTADSFLMFFNYYYLMFTKYTFEVGEEEEEEEEEWS
jgi:hypothetical protein